MKKVENMHVSPHGSNAPVSGSLFKNCYRIVSDDFNGYEAQVKFWWLPFIWFEMWEKNCITNTHASLKEAQDFIKYGSKNKKKKPKVFWVSENCR